MKKKWKTCCRCAARIEAKPGRKYCRNCQKGFFS